jgi:type III restriction enzyme
MTMTDVADKQRFRNEDLVLKVSPGVDRSVWDESRYEAFLDELCGDREYQKEAVRVALRYLCAGEYHDLRDLAKRNYDDGPPLQQRYGSWLSMERSLQLPDQLSGSLDLATGTGKSYVLYALAAILLAEGVVDRVLVLCPSTTIEDGLLGKFRLLAGDDDLRALLPQDAAITTPHIVDATETIVEGSICVENYHAVLEHVRSSVQDSLAGTGKRVAVLNDEAHHVANESAAKEKKWKQFLASPEYGFRYIIGVSGTCYVGDDYFSDVIYRYSLREAMEERYVKRVEYVAEMPKMGGSDERWQLIVKRHEAERSKLKQRGLTPLTIVVTPTIARCKDVADELRAFLVDECGVPLQEAEAKVLVVFNNAPDLPRLSSVDSPASLVEWIVSVSMLNEGWDVKRVFQIVPHEERAFNSKLLIAQVLGRGLRIPNNWQGELPVVTVFNHAAWAPRIRQLVNEVLEIESRLPAFVLPDSPHHFELHTIDYSMTTTTVHTPMEGEYTLFAKGYVDLASDSPVEDVRIELEDAASEHHHAWRTSIEHKTFGTPQVAQEMHDRLKEADEVSLETGKPTGYALQYSPHALKNVVLESLRRIGADKVTEKMRQKLLQSLGTLRRTASENVRYIPVEDRYHTILTDSRPSESVGASELRSLKCYFFTPATRDSLKDQQRDFFDIVTDTTEGFRTQRVANPHDLKTPLNAVIADSDNEKSFLRRLLEPEHVRICDAWLKNSATRFYEIDYAWKKGEHPKRGKFSPDFFLKVAERIIVVEIKGDEELAETSPENFKKNEYALAHFARINRRLADQGEGLRYKFCFLSPSSFNPFFQGLRGGSIDLFRSDLDVVLSADS